MPSSPLVKAAGLPPLLGDETSEPLDDESPTTDMALPPAVTGAAASATTCEPPTRPSEPSVTAVLPVPDPLPEPLENVDPSVEESPITLSALPPTRTGTPASASTCEPPAMLSVPEVLA